MSKRGRGVSADRILLEADRAKMFREKLAIKQADEDMHIRRGIQETIMARVAEGKNKEEIIEELSSNEKYLKYETFFDSWASHQIEKNNIQKEKQQSKQEEER